jgi:hypothetical protein
MIKVRGGAHDTVCGGELVIGIPPHIQRYTVPVMYATNEEAIEALYQKALDLNLLGFIDWLSNEMCSTAIRGIATAQEGEERVAVVKRGSETDVIDEANIDWQNQLYRQLLPLTVRTTQLMWSECSDFCKGQKLKIPYYEHTVQRDEHGQVGFIGHVTLGSDKFSAPLVIAHHVDHS